MEDTNVSAYNDHLLGIKKNSSTVLDWEFFSTPLLSLDRRTHAVQSPGVLHVVPHLVLTRCLHKPKP